MSERVLHPFDKGPILEEDESTRLSSDDMVSGGCPNTRPIISSSELGMRVFDEHRRWLSDTTIQSTSQIAPINKD